jgi:hypothetical protein
MKQEWISVKDRLPEIDNEYIVALDFLEVKRNTSHRCQRIALIRANGLSKHTKRL